LLPFVAQQPFLTYLCCPVVAHFQKSLLGNRNVKAMKISLRQRQKGKKISLYLDYYDKGKRTYEHLDLFLYPTPEKGRLTKNQRDHNKSNLELAETIRAKRHLEIQNGIYGFNDLSKQNASFIKYFENLVDEKMNSIESYGNWVSTLRHLKKFAKRDVTFAQIDKDWVEGFKSYLQQARTKSDTLLSSNSQSAYFDRFRAALKQARKDGIIINNPGELVKGIKPNEPQREFLTMEELQAVAKAECDIPILKKAFLFSCLTGLRWSDVNKMTWSEVQHSDVMGYYIRFRQKKTKGAETLPISDQAREMLGEAGDPEERVFKGLKYSAWHNLKLQQWVMRAGVSKTITFHCARHTYATLQLTLGTDIYTVSKLLGHSEIRTTQIYAKIIDEKKREAANKIKINI
jgi:integrase